MLEIELSIFTSQRITKKAVCKVFTNRLRESVFLSRVFPCILGFIPTLGGEQEKLITIGTPAWQPIQIKHTTSQNVSMESLTVVFVFIKEMFSFLFLISRPLVLQNLRKSFFGNPSYFICFAFIVVTY